MLVFIALPFAGFYLGVEYTASMTPSINIVPMQKTIGSNVESTVLKNTIKKLLVTKHGAVANGLSVTVSNIEGVFAKGAASEQPGGGGLWFAAKVKGQWKLVADGNGIILCKDLRSYPNFPTSMIPSCFDDQAQKLVTR